MNDPQPRRANLLSAAQHHIAAGQYAHAAGLLEGLLQANPRDWDALILVGTAMKLAGQHDDVQTIVKMLPTDSRDRTIRIVRAIAALENEPFAAVEPLLRQMFLDDIDLEYLFVAFTKHVLRQDEELSSLLGRAVTIPALPIPWPVRITQRLLENIKELYLWAPKFHNSAEFADVYYKDAARLEAENAKRVAYLGEQIVREAIVPGPGAKVLDVGCGDGAILELLARRYSIAPFGFDQSSVAESLIKARIPEVRFHHGDLYQMGLESDFFDACICTDVIEHLEDPAAVVASLVAMAKPGGAVFISVPDGRLDDHIGHLGFFSPESLRGLCRAYEHDAVKVHRFGLSVVLRKT